MFRDQQGKYILEAEPRLSALCNKPELTVSQEEFCNALKGYKLDEALSILGDISNKLFDNNFHENSAIKKEKVGFAIHKLTGLFLTDFAIEYISNILLISGSNNHKSLSIKNKDDVLALFNIYFSTLVQPINKKGIAALLVPMTYQQFSSQQDIKDAFTRQLLIFQSAQININSQINLDKILFEKFGMSIQEYVKLSFAIFAAIMNSPRFNMGKFTGSTIQGGLAEVLTDEKVNAILALLAGSPEELRNLDQKYNAKLQPEYTKNRYNPLWEKPIVKLGVNDYIAPSISAYVKGAFRGLYWIFENAIGKTFRDYFGLLFEEYVGMVLKDMYGESAVMRGIPYGTKKDKKTFFDWIVHKDENILLFEAKGYQFPLGTLQTGDPDLIRKEVFEKITKTIKQMYDRCSDVGKYPELKGFEKKKLTCVGIFYDIPLVSTTIYQEDIKKALEGMDSKCPGIKDFEYTLFSVEELENYYYVKDYIEIDEVAKRANQNPASGVSAEISKAFKENNLKPSPNFLDKKFKEFYKDDLQVPMSEEQERLL